MDPTGRFSSRVENYVRYRPGYPQEVLDLLHERYDLTQEAEIADVGSGTGALARMFLENGNRVYGVEPNDEMRRAGERLLAGFSRFTSVEATAEGTTLPDRGMDFVTAGQAFHWFDPGTARREFGRILKPNGRVALVWNARRTEETGFLGAYERVLQTHGTDYAEVSHGRRGSPEEVRGFFAPMPVEEWSFENAQRLDLDGLRGRVLSSRPTCRRRVSRAARRCWRRSRTFSGDTRTVARLPSGTIRGFTSGDSRLSRSGQPGGDRYLAP